MNAPLEWRPVAAPGLEVTARGDVRLTRPQTARSPKAQPWAGRVYALTQHSMKKSRYRYVTYRFDGRTQRFYVHQLVLAAFGPPRPFAEALTRHLDGTRTNNAIENLAWGSVQQNSDDSRRHGTLAQGERNGHARLTTAHVEEIRRRAHAGENYGLIAADFGIDRSLVSHVKRGTRWGHVPQIPPQEENDE